ncbi:glycoside hydrolase family 71 protein [Schizophyllum commune H4-8]|uniref:Glycoside hydrolase family 71 protein n=1 Tax=Schizophyllum commune (strain H4-8 / FGSC 9210) TaxID=578458 RepID=D8QDI6_SCHCM|nr:glycoside hydrolase family 71 protein [Schizophyllum commune H4-8]KAI5888703.1 glycoside hydrolase family 71 protein [Schizophyllum commune H4-8]
MARLLGLALGLLPFAARFVSAATVIAHFMAQQSYSYSQNDWANDIASAQSIGIEGFALNVAFADYEVDRIVQAYAAAEAANFKLMYSFDFAGGSWSQDQVVSLIAAHANSPATLRWNNKVLVSTYSGEGNGDGFFAGVKNTLAGQGIEITWAPAFVGYRSTSAAGSVMGNFPSIDGFFNWWSWPNDVNEPLTTEIDLAFQSAVKSANRGGPYIMSHNGHPAVSPWQFKDLNGDGWVQQSDTLWNYRWKQAIDEVRPDIVEIVTWNDFGESHYICDINYNVDMGDAINYVRGINHSAWRTVAKYYIAWYKTGSKPTLTEDTVVYWYRTHPKGVSCSGGAPVRMSSYPEDAIFALAMLADSTPSATVTLDVGSNHAEFTANGGNLTIGKVPFPKEDGQTPWFKLVKNGATVKEGSGNYDITTNCAYYNFNPTVGQFKYGRLITGFKILDTGIPDSDFAGYLTLVFLHGYGIPSIGVRLIAVNRRGYPGSSPYTAAESFTLKNGTLEERAAIYRDEGHHYAQLLDALVQDGTVGPGGVALVAWSIANAHLSATIAAVHELPDVTRERLSKHLRTFIYFEAVPKPMGMLNPPDGYIPGDPEASGHWFASYFAHDLASRDVNKLEKQHSDPTRPATDAIEGFYAKFADIAGAASSDELLFKPDMLAHLRAARDKALFDGEVRRAWGNPKVAYVWGGSSVWTSVWMAWALEDECKARGLGKLDLIF